MSTDHRQLSAFTLADDFAVRVYAATKDFPTEERYGLRSQIRRSAVSIPTKHRRELCPRDPSRAREVLEIAFGSAREVIYLIDLAGRLEMLNVDVARELAGFGGRIAAALAALRKARSSQALKP